MGCISVAAQNPMVPRSRDIAHVVHVISTHYQKNPVFFTHKFSDESILSPSLMTPLDHFIANFEDLNPG